MTIRVRVKAIESGGVQVSTAATGASGRGHDNVCSNGDTMSFNLATFTFVHVLLSLVGILSGVIVMAGLLAAKRLDGWTAVFLASTVATSVTGFGFPFEHVLPSHVVGVISLVVLAVAIFARYARHLGGAWRRIYVLGAVVALYLNVFVLIVQAFLKVPALKAMAPTQSEPPFLIAQLVVMALFFVLAIIAMRRQWTASAGR
jgi:hypothetical protein